MRVKEAISKFTSAGIWILAMLLAFCLLCAYVNPAVFSFTGIFTLITPVLIAINFIVLIYALIRAKITGWVTFIVLILSIPQVGNLWAFNFIGKKPSAASFSLMTYNVRNFDLYNWSHNERSREKIFEMLSERSPDVICFQEFYSQPGGKWDNIQVCRSQLGLDHYYFTRELILGEGRQWGIATFSRFPIVQVGELMQIPTENARGLRPFKGIYTDLNLGNDTVRVINIHLASVYLGREDYITLENITGQQEIDIKRSRSIFIKLIRAYGKRGHQVRQLVKFLENTEQPHPVIIAGDFNDIPTSYAYNRLSRKMEDAWLHSGWGPGATYNGPVPWLRIDQTFVDKKLTVAGSEIIRLDISDHSPMVTRIQLNSEQLNSER